MKNGEDRKGKFIAVANMKGGVGKTTTVVSLADSLAADDLNCRVLVVDLDPQASASVCIAGDDDLFELIRKDRTLEAFLEARLIKEENAVLPELIRNHISSVMHQNKQLDLSLLPCGPELRIVERELIFELAGRHRGMNAIDGQVWMIFNKDFVALRKLFDYIIFDCAPGISPVTEAAIRISDLVIVPTIPDRLSVYGLNAFHGSIWARRNSSLPKPKSPPHILLTRVQGTKEHKTIIEALVEKTKTEGSPYRMVRAFIPQSPRLPEALMKVGIMTLTQKYTSSIVVDTLGPLAAEVKGLL